jgi:hypothetical protein
MGNTLLKAARLGTESVAGKGPGGLKNEALVKPGFAHPAPQRSPSLAAGASSPSLAAGSGSSHFSELDGSSNGDQLPPGNDELKRRLVSLITSKSRKFVDEDELARRVPSRSVHETRKKNRLQTKEIRAQLSQEGQLPVLAEDGSRRHPFPYSLPQ